jgi:hypothetical protein
VDAQILIEGNFSALPDIDQTFSYTPPTSRSILISKHPSRSFIQERTARSGPGIRAFCSPSASSFLSEGTVQEKAHFYPG